MKYLYFLLLAVFITNNLLAQEIIFTHKLELLTPKVTEPYILDAAIYAKDSVDYIRIQFPDDLITAEYIVDSAKIKFQATKISDAKLVTIQFIGSGNIENKIDGTFTALVDCVFRKDMSGNFVLRKK
ncbi:MAG: hypothetical protein AB1521_06665 [Bacteroidota bacterium]